MNELQYNASTQPIVNTAYVVLTDAYARIWNGTQFVALTDPTATPANCCIAMTLLGGDLWAADLPAGMVTLYGEYTMTFIDAAAPAFTPEVGQGSITINPGPPSPLPPATDLPPMGPRFYSVSYTAKLNAGNVSYTFNPCKYSVSGSAEIHPSFGKYIRVEVILGIPAAILTAAGNYKPKPGDRFISPDGYACNVLECRQQGLRFTWVRGWCPTLSFNLQDTVQYLRASAASSGTTARTVTHSAVGVPVAAAIQPLDRRLADLFGTRSTPQSYVIWIYDGVGGAILAGDLFQDQNGLLYDIEAVGTRHELEELAAFSCIKKL